MTARTYLVGLPVAVTVHDDGRVEYWIDTAEAGMAINEIDDQEDLPDEATINADAEVVNADHTVRFAEDRQTLR